MRSTCRLLALSCLAPALVAATAMAAPQASPGVQIENLALAIAPWAGGPSESPPVSSELGFIVARTAQGHLVAYRESTGSTVDLGPAEANYVLSNGRVVYTVSESAVSMDLNGDGDALESVMHVHDFVTGVTTNLGVAAEQYDVRGDRGAMVVQEAVNGFTDFNENGWLLDRVLFTIDLVAGVAQPQLLRASHVAVGETAILFTMHEDLVVDLNGDGDFFDWVLHRLGPEGVTNYGISVSSDATLAWGGDLFSTAVSEAGQGVDYTGEGTLFGYVHAFVRPDGTLDILDFIGPEMQGSDSLVVMARTEFGAGVGGVDFDGDGDTDDVVFFAYEPDDGSVTNLAVGGGDMVVSDGRGLFEDGWASDEPLWRYDDVSGSLVDLGKSTSYQTLVGPWASYTLFEGDAPAADLTGDGDTNDHVLVTYDFSTGVQDVALDTGWSDYTPASGDSMVAAVVYEGQIGSDLNGDGDLADWVVHVVDIPSGQVWNTGLATILPSSLPPRGVTLVGDSLVVSVWEKSQGFTDLDGDGGVNDLVLHRVRVPVQFGLRPRSDTVSLLDGGAQRLSLDAGPEHAGQIYVVLGSLSGTTPGLALGAVTLPLAVDAYTQYTLASPGIGPLVGTFGLLDAQGRSEAPSLAFPAGTDPALAGVVAHHAFVALDALSSVTFASNAVRLELLP